MYSTTVSQASELQAEHAIKKWIGFTVTSNSSCNRQNMFPLRLVELDYFDAACDFKNAELEGLLRIHPWQKHDGSSDADVHLAEQFDVLDTPLLIAALSRITCDSSSMYWCQRACVSHTWRIQELIVHSRGLHIVVSTSLDINAPSLWRWFLRRRRRKKLVMDDEEHPADAPSLQYF